MPLRWYEFGPYRLNPAARVVLRENKPLRLTPKAVETLLALVVRKGAVVSKEQLLDEVWPGSFVGEGSLARNISDLRRILAGRGRNGTFIETIPKRGYRFTAAVTEIEENVVSKTIAVLPFTVVGEEAAGGDLSLGIADAVITKLSAIRECEARPTKEVSRYARSGAPALKIGQELKVEFVVDGTIQRCGDRVRVNAQLLKVKTGKPIWAETIEDKFEDVFSFEDSISEQLAGALSLSLSAEQRKLLDKRYTESAEAHQEYLRGRFHLNKRSVTGLKQSIRFFRQAIEIDSDYALAYSGLAASYAMLPMLAPLPTSKFMPKAKAAALSALEIDDTLAEARRALAFVRWHYDWDWPGAEREFKRLLKFQPRDAATHQWYGLLLHEMRRFGEAIQHAKKAVALDPESAAVRANLAAVLIWSGRYEESMEVARAALAIDPSSLRAHLVMGMALEQTGHSLEALEEYRRLTELSPGYGLALGSLGHLRGRMGDKSGAAAILAKLEANSDEGVYWYASALVHVGMGNGNRAVDALDRACASKDFHLVLLGVDKRFDSLRSQPRYEKLMRQVGLIE